MLLVALDLLMYGLCLEIMSFNLGLALLHVVIKMMVSLYQEWGSSRLVVDLWGL